MSSGQVSPMTPRSPPSTGHRQILAQHVSRPIVTPKDDCSTPGAGSQAAVDMQLELAERDVMISTLERQVEEQKQLRALETRQIEQKAARIKDWVSTKLKELEEQNVHLQEQNVKANQQLDQLKARLVQLSKLNTRPATARCSHLYLDLDNSFKGNGDNDEEIERLSRQVEAVAQELGADSVTMNPLYSMESPVKISQPKTPNPPAVKMGRKNYVYPGGADASLLSTSISDMSQDDREGSLLSLEAHLAASEAAIRNNAYTPMAPPSPIVIHSGFSKPASGAGSLDRSGRGPVRKLREGEIRGGSERDSRRKPSAAAGGVHAGFHSGAQRAPTPPLHRCPSWESRIYQVTSSGLHQSCNSLASSATGQKSLDIPMYTAVHGRAAKVTSATAESSDESSDGEAVTPKATDHALGMGHTAAGYHRTSHNNAPGHFKRDGSLDSVLSEDYAIPPDALSPSVSMDSLEPGTRETGEGPSDLTGVVTPPAAPLGHPLASPLGAGPRNGVHHGHTTGTHHGGPSHAAHMFVEQIEALHAHSASPKRHDTTTTHQLTEKCGYLSKLGGPLKTWRKRWFVLREGRLHYYKSEGDVLRRKVKGEVVLDEAARVQRTNEGMPTFEVVTARRTFSLTADSMLLMEEWLRAIQNALCRNATVQLLNSQDGTVKPVIQGWCTKVKHGRCRNCWCVLFQRTLLYFRSPNDTTPLGQINMRDCRVDEVDHVSSDSSDEDEVEDASREEGGSSSGPRAGGSAGTSRSYKESRRFTIGIFPSGGASTSASPSYLLFHDKHDFDTWLYHLTLVSSSEHVNGTELEQVLAKLAEAQEMGGGGGDGAASQTLWRSSILLFSRESLSTPLTSLPSSELQAEALKMFKSIQLFMSVPLDTSGIDYHVALAQNALDLCLATLQLRNEFFCQIIKQTSRHTHKQGMQQFLLCATQSLFLCDSNERLMREDSKLSDSLPSPGDKACAPVAFASTESKLNPAPFVFIQGFQLLAIALSLFQPRSRVLWFLRQHLTRVGDANTEIGKWALFCERALQRALDRPERACRPSRMEVLSLLLKNPYHHSHPHSIPVHFLNGTYQVVGFDGSTTVDEFVTTLNEEVNIRPCAGFYLFSDDPMDPTAEICLQPEDRLCDAISQWEQALREKHLGKFEMNKVIKLTYRNRLFFRASQKGETDKERLLTVYFLNREIVQGRFPLTKQMAVEFSALMAQIEFGDRGQHVLDESHSKSSPKRQILDRLLAAQFARDPDCWPQLEAKWVALRGRSTSECVRIFLNCVRSWHLCGAQLFSARYKSREQVAVWLSVNEDGVFLLDVASMKVLAQYPYAGLSTFGGCRGDFMLVAAAAGSSGPQDKMMFHIHSKQKMLELTLLIADYMNNVLGRFGTSQPASQASTLTAARSGIATPSSPLIGGDRALRSAKNSPMHTLKTSHHSSGLGAGEL